MVCPFEKVLSDTFPFWEKLDEEDKDSLCRSLSVKKYLRGDIIHNGDDCTGALIVKSGTVRIYLLSENGKEVTLARLYSNDLCMLGASCVMNTISFDVFMDAEEESECYLLSGAVFARVTKKNIYAENYVLNHVVSRFSDIMWAMQQILFMSFDRRLAIFLYEEMNKEGNSTVMLTHEQIAKYVGSAREVVTRMLKYFALEGIVENRRGAVRIIDKDKLKALALG
jgi:CRP/FNR family transcriptional regulator